MSNKLKFKEEYKDLLKQLSVYAITSTTLTLGTNMFLEDINKKSKKDNESLNAYIEGMSDEELEATLEQLNMLCNSEKPKEKTK